MRKALTEREKPTGFSRGSVTSCWNCRGIQVANMNCKTHRCPYCGTRLTLRRKRVDSGKFVLADYETARQAKEALNYIKMKASGKLRRTSPTPTGHP